jgi:hypothetical protein
MIVLPMGMKMIHISAQNEDRYEVLHEDERSLCGEKIHTWALEWEEKADRYVLHFVETEDPSETCPKCKMLYSFLQPGTDIIYGKRF